MPTNQLAEAMAGLTPAAQTYLQYLWDTMPQSDRDSYPPALFAEFAAHADMLRNTMPWCAEMDEQVFLDYVLYHRVNDEDISFNRAVFYEGLAPRVEGLSIQDAVLEVNRWCHEIATYEQQDDRTASPLTVFTSGSGRCGEESAFAVCALRSVGIPARQVYSPRWSHCDDNHAWVEAFCVDSWRFFGACEPEPLLDKGWFNASATRAALVHSRRFGAPGCETATRWANGPELDIKGPAVYHNQTGRYAQTREFCFTVTYHARPVPGARVSIDILNGAQLTPVLELFTGEDGTTTADMGMGDLYLRVSHALGYAEQMCYGSSGEEGCTIALADGYQPCEEWRALDFAAPPDSPINALALTHEQKQQRTEQLAKGNGMRFARMEAFWEPERAARLGERNHAFLQDARGNFGEIAAFLEKDASPLRARMLAALSPKDLRDATAGLLEDHLRGAKDYEAYYPKDVFDKYLLNPRIATERLTPWRGALAEVYSPGRRDAYRQNPPLLWQALCESDCVPGQSTYPNLFWTPDIAFATGNWDEKSRALLFVALLRSWGLPARLGAIDGMPEYWRDGAFVPVEPRPTAKLSLTSPPGHLLAYRQNWSLARREGDNWLTMGLDELPWNDDQLCLELPQGEYRLVTTVRLPNGNQLAALRDISLWQDTTVTLTMRGYQVQDLLYNRPLPAFSAKDASGTVVENPWLGTGVCTLLLWLQPGEEPTEHVLNELLEGQDLLAELDLEIVAFLSDEYAVNQPTMAKVAETFPRLRLMFGEWDDNIELLARHLYLAPDSPPLVVCCNRAGEAVYGSSGYNVGLVEFLAQAVRLL